MLTLLYMFLLLSLQEGACFQQQLQAHMQTCCFGYVVDD